MGRDVARNVGAAVAGALLLGALFVWTPSSRLHAAATSALSGKGAPRVECNSPWRPAVAYGTSALVVAALSIGFAGLALPRRRRGSPGNDGPGASATHRHSHSPRIDGARAALVGAVLGLACLSLVQRHRVESRLDAELVACRKPSPPPPPASAGPAPETSAAPAPSAALVASTARTYPSLATQVGTDCADPRVVLTARNTAREAALWVQQFLVVRPEYRVVESPPTERGTIELYWTQYGEKRFAADAPPPRQAVVARCFDATTCNELGAAFRASSQGSFPLPVCGIPPLEVPWHSSAPLVHSPDLAPSALVPAVKTSPWPMPCSRLGACAALHSPKPLPPDCVGIPGQMQRLCAALSTCEEVARCIGR